MNIELNMDNRKITLNFGWVPLQRDGRNIYLWELDEKKDGEDQSVIYRFVLLHPNAGKITIYVGEGRSLNGPERNNSVHQYNQTPGQTRQRIKEYILQQARPYGWTELILLSDEPRVDLSNEEERRFFQEILIGAYYQEHRELKSKFPTIPKFLNKAR